MGGQVSSEQFLQKLRGILQPMQTLFSDTLSAALNRATRVSLDDIQPIDPESLKNEFPEPIVLAKAPFAEGLSDEIVFLIPTAWAAAWGDLMIMGDGTASFAPEEHLDAVSELLNQLCGGLSESLTSTLGKPVRFDAVKTSLEGIAENLETLESYFRADFIVTTKDLKQASLSMLFSPDTVRDLQESNIEDLENMSDRPPHAVLDEPDEAKRSPEVRAAKFDEFGPGDSGGSTPQNIEILMDLELPVIIELGRTSMFIRDILELGPGSIVELSKLSGEPVDLYVNDKKFAQGEVVVIDENFGIRITDLVKVEDRIRSLK